jgi:AcrR family transcriptional regulator
MTALSRGRWDSSGDLEARRTEILRSLGEVLRERHASELRMQDIADRLGLTKGNLYYYFKSKQDLLFHCHMRSMEGSLQALAKVDAMRGSASERLHELLTLHIHNVLDESYGAVLLTDLENLPPKQRKAYIALRDKFEHGVREIIREGIAAGEFPDRNVTMVGFAILGGINWMSKWYDPSGAETSATIARAFADLYVAGLQAVPRLIEPPKPAERRPARRRVPV